MTSLHAIAFVLCVGIFCVVISAAPQYRQQQVQVQIQPLESSSTPVAIVSQSDENSPDGSFSSSFEAANGIRQQSAGFHKTVLAPRLLEGGIQTGEQEQRDIIVQTGSWSYTAPDGTVFSLSYIADENGFQPVAQHLPTPPPIPQQILESLQQQPQDSQQ